MPTHSKENRYSLRYSLCSKKHKNKGLTSSCFALVFTTPSYSFEKKQYSVVCFFTHAPFSVHRWLFCLDSSFNSFHYFQQLFNPPPPIIFARLAFSLQAADDFLIVSLRQLGYPCSKTFKV